MAAFLLLSTLTEQGARTITANPGQIEQAIAGLEHQGVRVMNQWAAVGPYDFVAVVEAPDLQTVLRMSAELAARGDVRPVTLPMIPMRDFVASLGVSTSQVDRSESSRAQRIPRAPVPGTPPSRPGNGDSTVVNAGPTGSRARRQSRIGNGHPVADPIQVQTCLKGVDYPASKQELIEIARRSGADETVIRTLEAVPERTYDGPNAVAREIGHLIN